MVLEAERVGDAFAPGISHDHLDAPVVISSMGEVPRFGGMVFPWLASCGLEMHKDFGAQWGEWLGIKWEWAIHRFVGRKERVEATGAHHDEGHVALWGESTPVSDWERRRYSGDARHKVIFPRPDGAFSWVGAMHIGGRVLDLDLLHRYECFDVAGCFVVQLVEEGMVAAGGEPHVHLVGLQEFFFGSVFDGDGCDVVGVAHIDECNVRVAGVGCDGEASWLIAEDAARHLANSHEHVVDAFVGGFLWCSVHVCVNAIGQEDNLAGGGGRFGGSDALSDLVHVATFKLDGDIDVTADSVSCEARESFEVACVEG
jgi:hypothetical protein